MRYATGGEGVVVSGRARTRRERLRPIASAGICAPVAIWLAEVMTGNDGRCDRPRRASKKQPDPEAAQKGLVADFVSKAVYSLRVGYLYGKAVVKRALCSEPHIQSDDARADQKQTHDRSNDGRTPTLSADERPDRDRREFELELFIVRFPDRLHGMRLNSSKLSARRNRGHLHST